MTVQVKNQETFKTKITSLLMGLTDEPLAAFYAVLPFILTKDLHINAFELSLFLMLRPIFSSMSFFWGIRLNYLENPNLLKNNIIAWIIARLPFLFFPFFNNFYFFLFASAIYQLFHKAGLPAWNEIIKRNVTNKNDHYRIFSTFPVYVFIENVCLGLLSGKFLDKSSSNWKLIFCLVSIFSLSSLFFQIKIKVPKKIIEESSNNFSSKEDFFAPFKDIFN